MSDAGAAPRSGAAAGGPLVFARRMVLADASWQHGHVYLGGFGLVTGRHDPLPHLCAALRLDQACAGVFTATHG